MSKEAWEWSAVAAANGFFPPADGGHPEGMSRQDVNDADRENLATSRRWYNEPEWVRVRVQGPLAADIGVFARIGTNTCAITLAGVNLSSYFRAGRIVKVISGSGVGVDLVTQCAVDATYVSGVTTIQTRAAINVAATDIYTHGSSILRAQAMLDDNAQFFIPVTADAAGIQAAIDSASTAGGGIVFLNQNLYSIGTQIDITGTKGNIVIWGKHPQVTLHRTAAIGSIINYSNASESFEIRNVKFDGDWLTNPLGNGFGLSIGSCLSVLIDACDFVRCESGIRFTGSGQRRITVRNSSFLFHRYGISTASAADTHEGVIEGCVFDGGLMSLPAPAAIRVSGQWLVAGNHLRAMTHATLVPVGIHIWDRTAAELGGIRSSVIGNTVSGGGTTGTGIWMGASDGACVGNTVSGGSATTGIRLGSNTAAAFAERILCQGNSVAAGSMGIQVSEFTRHGIVSDNSIRPNSGTSIVLGGDLMRVSDNVMRFALIGIDVLGTAVQNSIVDNTIMDVVSDAIILRGGCSTNLVARNHLTGTPSRGINVEATAADNLVMENWAPALAQVVTNLSSSTLIVRNQEVSNPHFVSVGGNGSVNSSETIEELIDLPAHGGIGTYLIEWGLELRGTDVGNTNMDIRFRAGTTGTLTDPVVAGPFTLNQIGGAGGPWFPHNTAERIASTFVVNDALVTKLIWSYEDGGSSEVQNAWLKVTKFREPLG